jgi:hypothetical protein
MANGRIKFVAKGKIRRQHDLCRQCDKSMKDSKKERD